MFAKPVCLHFYCQFYQEIHVLELTASLKYSLESLAELHFFAELHLRKLHLHTIGQKTVFLLSFIFVQSQFCDHLVVVITKPADRMSYRIRSKQINNKLVISSWGEAGTWVGVSSLLCICCALGGSQFFRLDAASRLQKCSTTGECWQGEHFLRFFCFLN